VPLVQRVVGQARAVPGRLFPGLDEWLWNRQRDRWCRAQSRNADYVASLNQRSVDPLGLPLRIVIVPMDGPDVPTWQAAGGNHFYEIWQSARELFGSENVELFSVGSHEPASEWHGRLIAFLQEVGATHLVFQVERDPNQPDAYSWDLFLTSVTPRWHGVLLGVIYDSAFEWITIAARRLAKTNNHFVLVDICQPMNGRLIPGREEASIVTMAISNQTVAAVDTYVQEMPKDLSVSFIGALYPDRVEMLQAIRGAGVDVSVNPHRPDITRDFVESRVNQPTYLDYMAGLHRSRMTINLSTSSSGNGQQLKTRVLEACLVGTVVLTDDRDRAERFWTPGRDFVYFDSVEDLAAKVAELDKNPARQDTIGRHARARARELNNMGFWGGIDKGLKARNLPPLVDLDH